MENIIVIGILTVLGLGVLWLLVTIFTAKPLLDVDERLNELEHRDEVTDTAQHVIMRNHDLLDKRVGEAIAQLAEVSSTVNKLNKQSEHEATEEEVERLNTLPLSTRKDIFNNRLLMVSLSNKGIFERYDSKQFTSDLDESIYKED